MRNIFYLTIALLLSISSIKAQDTSGTDFWVTFGYNPQGGKAEPVLQIRIVSGDNPTTGSIHFTNLGTSVPINIPAQHVMTYTLTPTERVAALNLTQGQSNYSVHITTDNSVMAFVMNQNNKSTDATNLLPVPVLGTDYYQISYMPYNDFGSNYLDAYAVIATEDNTAIFHNGTPLATLNTGQLYYKTSASDMTGALITSNKRIAFIAMNQGPQIPETHGLPDCLMQQLAPIETWGKTFFVPVTIKGNDVVRIVASQNNTNITTLIGGTIRSASGSQMNLNNLQAGQFVELDILLSSNGCYIEADKPIGVCTYMTVPEYIIGGGSLGDPSQCWIPGIAQSVPKALVSAFVPTGNNTEIDSHYALIITPTITKNNTLASIGGAPYAPLSGGVWHDNTAVGMSFYNMPFPTNNLNIPYTFTNDNGMVVMCYGLGDYESYYYLASSAMRNLSAAFTANGIPYNLMFDHFFCENEINFIANVEGIDPNPGSLNWYIDGVHQPALTDQLTWSQTFAIGSYAIKMTVLFEDETTGIYEGTLNIIQCGGCLELYATGISSDGFIELEWQWLPPAPTDDYTFTLHQWDEVLGCWQIVSTNCDKTIQVLNVYPDIEESNTLQGWMKVIANTLWYLAQLTTETTAKVCSAPDLAAPDTPTINRLDCHHIDIQSKDNGSLYRFYIKATNTTNEADTCISNILEVINKSGLKGFYILEDYNPIGIPEPSNPATIFMAAVDYQWISYTVQNTTKYIHIQAIDSVGNLSEVVTLEPLEECNCDPISDFTVLQPNEGEVLFMWNKPASPDFIGVRILRNGIIIAPLITPPTCSYTDYVSVGNHIYCLIGLYNNPDCMESKVCRTIYIYEQCDPVIEVYATVVGADKVQVNWLMPSDALGFVDYSVYCDNVLLGNTDKTLYIHENVTLGEHIYSVVVNYQKPTEVCTESEHTYSNPVFIETCVMIENVTVTEVTKESITITWTAADDVETFNVYRDNKLIANVNETTYTDEGAFAEGVVYMYCVVPVYHTCQVSPACAEAYMEPCIPFNVTDVVATGNKDTKTAYITWDYTGANATFNIFKNNVLIGSTANKNYTDNVEYDFIYKYCVAPLAECAGGAVACDTVLIDTPTGITDWTTGLAIYPNPTNGELKIENGKWKMENVEIYDVMGCVVYTVETRLIASLLDDTTTSLGVASTLRLDISHLPTGIYFLRIQTETDVVVRKVVKN